MTHYPTTDRASHIRLTRPDRECSRCGAPDGGWITRWGDGCWSISVGEGRFRLDFEVVDGSPTICDVIDIDAEGPEIHALEALLEIANGERVQLEGDPAPSGQVPMGYKPLMCGWCRIHSEEGVA